MKNLFDRRFNFENADTHVKPCHVSGTQSTIQRKNLISSVTTGKNLRKVRKILSLLKASQLSHKHAWQRRLDLFRFSGPNLTSCQIMKTKQKHKK